MLKHLIAVIGNEVFLIAMRVIRTTHVSEYNECAEAGEISGLKI